MTVGQGDTGMLPRHPHPEPLKFPRGGAPFRIDLVDAGGGGAALQDSEEGLEGLAIALGENLDGAVETITHPAGESEAVGVFQDKVAEADALDAPVKGRVEAGVLRTGH